MSSRVRRANPADAAALRAIRLEALLDSRDAYGTTYADVADWDLERWADLLATNAYFLGEVDGAVRGMAQGGYHDDFPGQTWLFGMFVGPDARASGLADELIDAVEEWARLAGAGELHLAVVLEMSRAVSFYRRRGFVEVGEVRYMKRNPSRQIQTMARPLTSATDLRVALVSAVDLYDLRRRVLRANDPAARVANAADEDGATRHYGGYVDGELLVSASFFAEGGSAPGEYQLRYMATDPRVQGRGYGAGVLAVAEHHLASEGATRLWANARDSALGFYRRLGWRVIKGSEHVSLETQIAHTVIEKDLSP